MPANRPRASFDPIPPTFDLRAMVEETPNFQFVDRISCDMIDKRDMAEFDDLVLSHVIKGGKPLVIDGYQDRLDPWAFSPKWLRDNHGDKVENARNLSNQQNIPLTIAHYLKNMAKLTEQYFERPENYRDKNRQRVYLKDIDCPSVWLDKLKSKLPPHLLYLNESIGDLDGPGATDELAPGGGKRRGKGIAPAGDLMSCLPPSMRAENLMCYIGHEGTYTPAHREMCASMGHNIMVEASGIVGEDGPERPGSSIWFMTESKDRYLVSEYWLSTLGHDIEVESHFAQLAAWRGAPFTTYIVEQRPGDFILIPPLAPHQVWNRGTRTMKVAWNRTTLQTLEMAMSEALPRARMVCRDEQYKNKAIIYYTLQKYSSLLAKTKDLQQKAPTVEIATAIRRGPKVRQLFKEFKRLLLLYRDLLLSEMFSPDMPNEKKVQFLPFDGNVTCAYCRGNIFNRFLTCPTCTFALGTEEEEPYDVCMECYAMGRSCGCISKLRWVEQFKWKELVRKYEDWREQHIEFDGAGKEPPKSLQEERDLQEKKTLAQICQEQLKKRPWVDITKTKVEDEESEEHDEIEIDENGMKKNLKIKKGRSEAWLKNHRACHVCCHRHEIWKMAECKCRRWWCYGTLFRAHDLMPQTVMEDPDWECPHCKQICSAGNCRKDPRQTPYEPKGTLLGHDTKKVADARSVESLVDFGVSNLNWLKEPKHGQCGNIRLKRRQEEANHEKLNVASGEHSDDEDPRNKIAYSPDGTPINSDFSEFAAPGITSHVSEQLPFADYGTIDPALHEDQANSVSYAFTDIPEGFQPASQTGFAALTALTYHASVDEDNDFEHDSLESRKKRNTPSDSNELLLKASKKRRKDKEATEPMHQSKNGATSKFRKEQERRALEEARKNDCFIRVHAALKGRQKIIKLPVGKEALQKMLAKDMARRGQPNFGEDSNHDEAGNNILLQSDIISAATVPTQSAPTPKSNLPNQFRYRVERNEEFDICSRKIDGISLAPTNTALSYELVIDSEDEDDANHSTRKLTSSVNGSSNLSWGAREENGNLPHELPQNFKDGQNANPRGNSCVSPVRSNAVKTGASSATRDEDPVKDVVMLQKPAAMSNGGPANTTSKTRVSIFEQEPPGGRSIEIISKAAEVGGEPPNRMANKNAITAMSDEDYVSDGKYSDSD